MRDQNLARHICLNSLRLNSNKWLSISLFCLFNFVFSLTQAKENVRHQELLKCFDAETRTDFRCLSIDLLIKKCSQKFSSLAFQYKIDSTHENKHIKITVRDKSTSFDLQGPEIQGRIFLYSSCDNNEPSPQINLSKVAATSNQTYDPFTNVDRSEEISKDSLKLDCLDSVNEMKPLKNISGLIEKLKSTCESGETAGSIETIATAKFLSNNEFIFQGELTADRFLKENEQCIEINDVQGENEKSGKKTVGCHSVFNSNVVDQNCVQAAMSNSYGNESERLSVFSATNLFRQHIKENCYVENLNRGGGY